MRTALLIVSAGWLVCMLLHVTIDPEQPGIIIDFIDNRKKQSLYKNP